MPCYISGLSHSVCVKSIETHARAFLPLNISAISSVATDSNSFLELYGFDFSNTYEQGFDLQWFHASKDLILSSYSDVKIDTKNMLRRNH